jgi:putative ABC transport system permease protein
MLKNYLKITVRNLNRYKIYSLINITGLGIGIACAVLILLWVRYELSYDKFHENAKRLYMVGFTTEKKDFYGFYQPGPLAQYLKENFPDIKQATNYSDMQWKISRGTDGFFCTGSMVSPDFFQMFSFPLEEGNPNTILTNPNSIVISRSLAKKIFKESNPVGSSLKLNDQPGFIVTGVFSDVPKTSTIQFDFVIPFSNAPDWMNMWDRKCVNTYVLLNKNASFDDVNEKISQVMNKHNPEWKNLLYLFPLTSSHLYEPDGTGTFIYIYIFSLFGILVIVVACINFMNLSTARSEKRIKEIGIRKTVGSSRIELIKQFMTETIVLSFFSLIAAILLVELSLPYLNGLVGTHISMNYSGDMIFIVTGIALLTGLIAGSYPAIYLSSFKPMSILSGRNEKTGKNLSSFLRKILVIAQFAFSIFIVTCVLFISKQLNFIQSKNLGFNKDQVVVISTRGGLQQNISVVKEELLKYSFVQSASVSATNLTSFEGAGSGPIDWEGKNSDKILEVGFNFVDEDFAKTFQIKMIRGRFFSDEYSSDMEEAFVVNEAAVKAMDVDDPLHKNLTTWFGRKGKIVGVISDFNTESLKSEMIPVVLIPTKAANYLFLRISSTDIAGAIKSIKSKIKEIVPDDPFEYNFLDEKIDNLYKTEQMTGKLAAFIAVIAIFISCLGLFGLVSFSSEQRTKEIGIRKVLGASVLNVLFMLTKDFTKWILIANIIACPIAWYAMNKWLQDFAYRIDINLWIFILSGAIALVIALTTVSYQAIKAATANPIKSLRYE